MDRRDRFLGDEFVAELSRLFARRFRRKATQQDQKRFRGLPVGFAMGQHALDHAAAQPCRAAGGADITGFMAGLERDAAAIFTVERSRASLAIRPARSALNQFLATTNCANVSESFATRADRVAAGKSSSTSIDSRIAARRP